MEIDNFKEAFINQLTFQMARAGKCLKKGEIIIIDEFVKQVKSNNLDLKKV